ncbi:MAG: hypothetical protein V3U82_03080 [Robiginitomaculum sp.]
MPHFQIHDLAELKARLSRGEALAGAVIQGVDITAAAGALTRADISGAVFLGCEMGRELSADLIKAGAVVFPAITGLPFAPYRNRLYTREGLFSGFDGKRPRSYNDTPDAQIYAHFKARGGISPDGIIEALARRLHDFSITDALTQTLKGRDSAKTVAIMGGHNLARGSADYCAAALMARSLTNDGYLLLSGGGPGAMEATHLGASMAGHPKEKLLEAIKVLSKAPSYKDEDWLALAFTVIKRYGLDGDDTPKSIAIPTWLYGHEPPTPFAPLIAKYFSNSVREEGLITLASGGIIFAPGNAGTIQEIFQDFAQNHYATTGLRSPMVFFNRDYWNKTRPIYPIIKAYAKDEPYGDMITSVDRVKDAVEFIKNTPPR